MFNILHLAKKIEDTVTGRQPQQAPAPQSQPQGQPGILGMLQPRMQSPVQSPVQQSYLQQPIQMGRVRGVEGFVPQDTYGRGELDTGNYLQPSYQNQQASVNGVFQQPGNQPNSGFNVGIQGGADPYGWAQSYLMR